MLLTLFMILGFYYIISCFILKLVRLSSVLLPVFVNFPFFMTMCQALNSLTCVVLQTCFQLANHTATYIYLSYVALLICYSVLHFLLMFFSPHLLGSPSIWPFRLFNWLLFACPYGLFSMLTDLLDMIISCFWITDLHFWTFILPPGVLCPFTSVKGHNYDSSEGFQRVLWGVGSTINFTSVINI